MARRKCFFGLVFRRVLCYCVGAGIISVNYAFFAGQFFTYNFTKHLQVMKADLFEFGSQLKNRTVIKFQGKMVIYVGKFRKITLRFQNILESVHPVL